jgi:hypothetical protein
MDDVARHDASHPHPNVSAQLSSLDVIFNAHAKLLKYDLASKVRSDSLSREEVSGLIQESEKESREYDREIERLKTEIGRLESAIVALRKGQKELETVTKQFRTALCPCPIRKLPAELLSEIFRLAFPDRRVIISSNRSPCIRPLIFAHACARWRSIAFDTPSLWSVIIISLTQVCDDDDPKMITCERAVTFILEQSRSHPLSLDIRLDDSSLYHQDFHYPRLPRVMERLVRESCRWHSVKLSLYPTSSTFNFWGLTLDLPNLLSFELGVTAHPPPELPPLVAFQNAPMLRKLSFGNWTTLNDRIRVLLPWHQLETIKCPCSPTYSPAMLISSCPNLKSAHLVYTHDMRENQMLIPEPLTTSIDSLVLECQVAVDELLSWSFSLCLKQLRLNSLRLLNIYSENTSSGTVLLQFEIFIKLVSEYRSLTSLRLRNVAFCYEYTRSAVDEGALKLLKNLASLKCLEIVEGNSRAADRILQDLFVQALTVPRVGDHRQQNTPVLPVLQHLIFEAQGKYLKDRSLVDLVCSRWCPLASDRGVDAPVEPGRVTSLSSVRFVLTDRTCDAEVFQPLVDMAAAGLNVTVIDTVRRVV